VKKTEVQWFFRMGSRDGLQQILLQEPRHPVKSGMSEVAVGAWDRHHAGLRATNPWRLADTQPMVVLLK